MSEPKPLDLDNPDFFEELTKEIATIQDEGADNIAERIIELVKQRIKQAVLGLISDLERAKRHDTRQEIVFAYDYCIYLVKKWFADVINGGE